MMLVGLGHITFDNFKGLNGEGFSLGVDKDGLLLFCLGIVLLLIYFILTRVYKMK